MSNEEAPKEYNEAAKHLISAMLNTAINNIPNIDVAEPTSDWFTGWYNHDKFQYILEEIDANDLDLDRILEQVKFHLESLQRQMEDLD